MTPPRAFAVDPEDPRAPPEEVWNALSAEERRRVVDMLPAARPQDREKAERALAEARRLVDEERMRADELRMRADELRMRADELRMRADELRMRAEEERKRADEAEQRAAALQAELDRLRRGER
ncbi:hypothetical protein [Polyangium fumosum]|uniref:Uncharacterized protein n=1 Tax=Polyangium fumosum TaxID=889272 RepID=A0A4U1JFG2_9BACT|nr:hypothetical protein [Polyangium fumosum]TKD09996.1 hypothetical protein E8A74_10340 [Polyangium fumosum]